MWHLPVNASAHGHEIDTMIYLVHYLMFGLFIGWGLFFIFVIFRFNKWANPKANYQGVQSHFSSYIEISVIVAEVILLIGFSLPFWSKHVDAFPDRTDRIEVRIVAEQYAWNVHYPGADKKFGRTSPTLIDQSANPIGLDRNDPAAQDDFFTVNDLVLPIGRPALIHLSSKDVIHSFSLPVMRVKQDVIPGMSIQTWFTPVKTGDWEIACAQLCGLGHYRMRGFLLIKTEEDFQKWVSNQTPFGSAEEGGDYDDFWN